jgi:hypothetical protein
MKNLFKTILKVIKSEGITAVNAQQLVSYWTVFTYLYGEAAL